MQTFKAVYKVNGRKTKTTVWNQTFNGQSCKTQSISSKFVVQSGSSVLMLQKCSFTSQLDLCVRLGPICPARALKFLCINEFDQSFIAVICHAMTTHMKNKTQFSHCIKQTLRF